MIGRLFLKKGGDPRNSEKSGTIVTHWSEIERTYPDGYNEWMHFIRSEINRRYKESLPPETSIKCKKKFVKVVKIS